VPLRLTACATPPSHIVVAAGADPIVPPIPGLRELDGIWTNREATGMKAIPRRLLVVGGGPVGVEMAPAVRWLAGEVVLLESAYHMLPREPAPLGEALGEVLRRDGIELALGVRATAARREAEEYVLELDDGRQLRGDRLLVATGRRPRVEGLGLETVGIEPDPTASGSTRSYVPASACGRLATSPASGR
jgi:pyruvate/2-oxoglutarate dehydrogenase complex dihydrolipoamide dehydrogenase (E3) component